MISRYIAVAGLILLLVLVVANLREDHRLILLLVLVLAIFHRPLRKDHRGAASTAAWGTRALNQKRPAAELINEFERFGYVTVYHSDEGLSRSPLKLRRPGQHDID